MKISGVVALSDLGLCACSKPIDLHSVTGRAGAPVDLTFTCTHEIDRLPAIDPDAEMLFRYGRYSMIERSIDLASLAQTNADVARSDRVELVSVTHDPQRTALRPVAR